MATLLQRLRETAGGPGRLRVVVLLAAALSSAAGVQTIAAAVAPDLKQALGIDNVQIGLLVTAASLMGAATTLPFGLLADRVPRVRLLAGCVVLWSTAIVIEGSAQSYGMVLAAQLLLGAGIGAATPVVASLTGDLFPPADRGRVFGLILAGEFAGAAVGLLVAGEIAALWSWRGSFWLLAIPSLLLAVLLLRLLPEPVRGGMGELPAPVEVGEIRSGTVSLAQLTTDAGVEPNPALVLTEDPTNKSLRWAVRYVLSIRSNVLLIVASALAYYYTAGMQTFAVVFLRGRFDLGQGIATALLVVIGLGVITGTLVTGPLSDRFIARGRIAARPIAGGLSCLAAVIFFVPGFFAVSLAISLPLFFLGSAGIGGANPPLDAARLDIMHSRLWGRAESVRNFLQTLLKSSAPLVFGWLSGVLSPAGDNPDQVQGGGAIGLDRAFLVMLVVLAVAAGILLLAARRWYPRDVATAIASERATRAG
ncbi:MFS transporter [Nakamurella lactea]|uniref:MFS transporter n=1 Tax=Nakamurella lactea TaxID=459515 RepID=UPI0003FB18AD|nr:MFS transporter [Nakamurella lactea]